MGSVAPNFDGFQEAQERLRENFGHELTFRTPGVPTWPTGTQLDPESGQPFDPTVEPIATDVEATVKVSVVHRPMGLSRSGVDPDTEKRLIGWIQEGGIVLIVDPDDYSSIEGAESFTYAGATWTIRSIVHEYLGPVDRYLVFARRQ